jgi:hypothetical protein
MKKEVLKIKDWLKATPQYIIKWDNKTFIPYAQRKNDKKRFNLGYQFVIPGGLATIEEFDLDRIFVSIRIESNHYDIPLTKIEINSL